ncbi:MAG: hypothetical protein LBP50_10395 [Tannerella sp.]|jgi:hypothetical protein|nr:hypothetical protein [Tannerella sp.]
MKMKQWSLHRMSVALWITAMTMSTSCLEGGRNTVSNTTVGMIRLDAKAFKNVLDVPGGTFYAPQFDTMSDGACCIVRYELDFDAPENSLTMLQAYGYYTVMITYKEDVDKYLLLSALTDTAAVLPEETAVMDPVTSCLGYLKGMLFVAHQLKKASDQREIWHLSYDPQTAVKEENGRHVFDVYLRATVRVAGTRTPEDSYEVCAYDMKYFLESAAERVKNAGNTLFSIRFNYVSEIGENALTWNRRELELQVTDILQETAN